MATIRINRGKWQAIVRRTGFSQQSKSFDSKTNARKWARQKEAELDAGIIQTDTRILDTTTVSDSWLKAGIQIAVATGMRRGELLSVLWSDVSFTNSTLLIRETKNGHPRCIPLSDKAVAILRSQKPRDWKATERVFPVRANAFQISWQRCKQMIAKDYPDISDLRFHDLRHEAISRFFEIGLSVPEVALISGHRDPRVLFRYTHLRVEDIVSKINSFQPMASKSSRTIIRSRKRHFQLVCSIKPDHDAADQLWSIFPQDRYDNVSLLALNKYGAGPFCKFKIPSNFWQSGVYLITLNDTLKYIGECQNLSQRHNAGYGNATHYCRH